MSNDKSEPVYRCHTCEEFTSPPRPFGFYVECGKCGGLTAATAEVEHPRPPAQIPEGLKLVPSSPTEEMYDAFQNAPFDEDDGAEFIGAYQAMLDAAPAATTTHAVPEVVENLKARIKELEHIVSAMLDTGSVRLIPGEPGAVAISNPAFISNEDAAAVVRAFWRRIHPYVYSEKDPPYPREFGDELPVEFLAHMATALCALPDRKPSWWETGGGAFVPIESLKINKSSQVSGDQIVSVFERRGMRIELGAQFSVRGQIAQLIEGVRDLLTSDPSPQVPECIHIDNERLAIFEAIQAVKIGNPTDDKIIVDNLHKAGYCVSKVPVAPEYFSGLPYVCKGDWSLGTACGMCERCQDMRGEAGQ